MVNKQWYNAFNIQEKNMVGFVGVMNWIAKYVYKM